MKDEDLTPFPAKEEDIKVWDETACTCESREERHYIRCAKWKAVIQRNLREVKAP